MLQNENPSTTSESDSESGQGSLSPPNAPPSFGLGLRQAWANNLYFDQNTLDRFGSLDLLSQSNSNEYAAAFDALNDNDKKKYQYWSSLIPQQQADLRSQVANLAQGQILKVEVQPVFQPLGNKTRRYGKGHHYRNMNDYHGYGAYHGKSGYHNMGDYHHTGDYHGMGNYAGRRGSSHRMGNYHGSGMGDYTRRGSYHGMHNYHEMGNDYHGTGHNYHGTGSTYHNMGDTWNNALGSTNYRHGYGGKSGYSNKGAYGKKSSYCGSSYGTTNLYGNKGAYGRKKSYCGESYYGSGAAEPYCGMPYRRTSGTHSKTSYGTIPVGKYTTKKPYWSSSNMDGDDDDGWTASPSSWSTQYARKNSHNTKHNRYGTTQMNKSGRW
jgi:hypothetical protein